MIEGTILKETDAALLFLPNDLSAGQEKWVPRSVIPRVSRTSRDTPCAASIRIDRWKLKQLQWEGFDDDE
jgi:hypothetical protein